MWRKFFRALAVSFRPIRAELAREAFKNAFK